MRSVTEHIELSWRFPLQLVMLELQAVILPPPPSEVMHRPTAAVLETDEQ